MSGLKIIISGGGTGGHIFPAVAIANAIKEEDRKAEILFVGASGKMEMEKVPQAGYRIIGLPIRGIQRKLSPSNLWIPFRLFFSILKSIRTIWKFKPDVVVGVGGYASAAIVFTATLMGKKTLIQEQNSFAGVTNKILGRRVNRICVAFEGMEQFFPKEKILLTGNPIRQNIVNSEGKRLEGLVEFQLDASKKTILAVGGSLGARTINQSMLKMLPILQEHNAQLIWQCGSTGYDFFSKELAMIHAPHVHLFKFIESMDLAYAAADLVVSRSGALSVSEIVCLRKPAILIPSPHVAEDHQTKNAMALVDKEAAVLLTDAEAPDKIAETVDALLKDESKIKALKDNLENVFSSRNAATTIAKEIIAMSAKS